MRIGGLFLAVAFVVFTVGGLAAAETTSAAEYSKNAQSAFRSGEYKTAAKLWEKAVKLDPSDPDLRDGLGKAYERQAEASSFPIFLTAKARQNFIRALQLQPDHSGAIADLIDLNQRPIGLCEGNLQEASQLIDRLETVDPDKAARERDYWKDAKEDSSRAGQVALCGPVKLSRVVAGHFVPRSKVPASSPKDSVVAEVAKPIETIGAGLN
jgi:tetratricopeptide (TPR) repeat protein